VVRRWAAKLIVALRYVLVPLWVGFAVLALLFLPPLGEGQGDAIGTELLPEDSPALEAELLSKQQFPVPLITRTVVVRDAAVGLPPGALAAATQLARDIRAEGLDDVPGLAAVIPVPNTVFEPGLQPTTILYFLYFRPEVGSVERYELAQRFADRYVDAADGEFVGVTGTEPASIARSAVIPEWLPVVTLATIALIVVAVGLFFASPIAPLVNLLTVGIAYVVASGVLGWLGQTLGLVVPPEVEPVVVVLMFGVVTDYTIFYLSHFRRHLREGSWGRVAAERAAHEVNGIVLVAGLVVALSTAALVVAELSFFRAFGPALALAVLIGAVVCVTFVPAVLAILGRFALWPQADRGGETESGLGAPDRSPRAKIARFAVTQPLAAVLGCVAVLGLSSVGLLRYELGNPVNQSLPPGSGPQQAYTAATTGFTADGVLSPTVAIVRGDDLASQPEALRRLGLLLAREPGVQAVIGPNDIPTDVEGLTAATLVSTSGDLARYLVVLRSDPLDGPAVNAVRALIDRGPALMAEAGLGDAELLLGGDTAISATLVDRTVEDLLRVAPAALLAAYLMLAVFLRSLVAPVYLVATSVLALMAALGLSAVVFEPLLDPVSVAFFVPFTVSVLLLGLGSDYNVFLVGRIWDEAARRPLTEAVQVASTRAARSIATAGVVLAGSFGLLGLVPLTTFHAIALTMVIGLLLDAFLVRQLLVPALIVLVGPRSGWPGRRLGRPLEQPALVQASSGSDDVVAH